jgi:hypothetical protein
MHETNDEYLEFWVEAATVILGILVNSVPHLPVNSLRLRRPIYATPSGTDAKTYFKWRKMMERKERKHEQSAMHSGKTADLDKTEAGPSRLYAPGKPREVEAGPSRLQSAIFRRQQPGDVRGRALIERQVGNPVDTREAGSARIVQYRK